MPDTAWNRTVWGKDYAWPQHGDEWQEFAVAEGVPYEQWKTSLIKAFVIPAINSHSTVLEIGAGHGRWSALLAPRVKAGTLHLVDLNESCIAFCKERFKDFSNVQYWVNDGKSLPGIKDRSVDFIWSFDTFVHLDEAEVDAYAREMSRVLRRQCMGVIHHAGNPAPEQRAAGCRSVVTKERFAAILGRAGLSIIRQTDSWEGGSVRSGGDCLTVFVRP